MKWSSAISIPSSEPKPQPKPEPGSVSWMLPMPSASKDACGPGWIHVREEEQLRPEDHAFHPSGRVGTPEDIARACLFLCDEANDFLNGQTLTIDGGATIRMIYPE